VANRSSFPLVAVAFFALLGWLRGGLSSGGSAAGAGSNAGRSEATTDSSSKEAGGKPGSGQKKASGSSSSGGEEGAEPWRRPLGLFEEFFGLSPDPRESRDRALRRLRATLHPKGEDARSPAFDLKLMIALVPDPLESQQPAAFDQAVDAIQHGFAYASGVRKSYLPDRIWIPWDDKATIKSRGYRASPGLLLFRRVLGRPKEPPKGKPPEPPEIQVFGVFLVGETPKAGIHKPAFREALRLITELSGGAPSSVRILGPSYSGSAVSLRLALLDWRRDHQSSSRVKAKTAASRFIIVTGSARAPCLESLFERDIGEVSFYRAQTPLDVLLSTSLYELHRRMGWNLHRMVLITEIDTSFGDSVPNPDPRFGFYQSCRPRSLPSEVGVVRFPSHISAIRTARVAAGLDRQETDASPAATPPPVTDLQLDLSDRKVGADVVPDFSPLSAPGNELAVANLLSVLTRDDVRYVGILASDIKDTIFLADRVRRLAPNVSLFGVEGNLLLTHPQVLPALEGMTVASGTRLFTSRISWEHAEDFDPVSIFPAERRGLGYEPIPWQLTTSFETGIYQATVELLSPVPLEAAVRPDAGAVWISVVGKDALWPIGGKESAASPGRPGSPGLRVLSFDKLARLEDQAQAGLRLFAAGEQDEAEGADNARDTPPPLSLLWSREAMLGSDLGLVLAAALLCAAAWWLHKAALLPAPARDAAAERGTRRLLVAGLAVLVLAGAMLLMVCGLPHWSWPGLEASPIPWTKRQGGSFAALAVAYVYLMGSAIYAAGFRRSRGGRFHALRSGSAAVATLVATAAVPPGFGWLAGWSRGLYDADFHQRVRAFASGLSPLVSLAWLVGAFYLWALVELRRRRLTAWQRIDWPMTETFEPALQGCSLLLGAIRWLLVCTLPRSLWRWLVLAAGFAVVLALTWHLMQPATEPQAIGRLMLILWALAAVLSVISAYRFLRLWQNLRQLLVRIEATPLSGRLKRLSAELHWKPMQAFGLQMPPFQTLIDSLVRLKQLVREGKLDLTRQEAAEFLSNLDRLLGLAFAANVSGKVGNEIASREEVQRLIGRMGEGLVARRSDPEVADFFAVRVAAYLRYVFAQLRSALITALGPALLLLIAVSSYTFQPKGVVTLGLLVLVVGEIALAISAFVEMSRDTVLSLIAGNPPGEVTLDFHFISSVVTFGVVPLVGLVATQVPDIGQLLNSALKPLLHLAGSG
jgi:hypothetical protein